MRTPFKFLAPYTLADKDVFFGRDKEIQQLHQQVLQTRLLLLYGLSGTGKTSLVQCGLASKFNGPDWLPLWIRHQGNIDESLQTAIQRLLPTARGSISQQIRQLYQRFLRPVYLLFDQFEELFILGTPDEQKNFALTLKEILDEDLPCTIVLVMREEYIGRLNRLENVIPTLFDFRLRVEPMDNANIKTFLRESFKKFNITVETLAGESQDARLDEIIQNITQENTRIELPYLQVYLDRLYRKDFESAYPGKTILDNVPWPDLIFTRAEIEAFGTIDKVLDAFLEEQIQRIQGELQKADPTTPANTVKLILDGFVTDESTKRPVRFSRQANEITIDPAQQDFFPKLAGKRLTQCLEELEKAKILRMGSDTVEIAHDSLAKIIDGKRTAEQRERNNMKRQIRLALDTFPNTKEYLTPKQLVRFEDVFSELGPKEKVFFEESRAARKKEANDELEQERQRSAELEKALNEAEAARAKNQRIIDAFYFYDGRFALALNETDDGKKYGFINKDGDAVIEYLYHEATTFDEYDGYARVKKGDQKYLLDTSGHEYVLAQELHELTDQTTALDLSGKQLGSLPESLFNQSQLSVLLLYQTSLSQLPEQIGQLTNLQTLDLSANDSLNQLPEQIGQLENLLSLNLRATTLSSLPKQIGQLSNLQTLVLNHTSLKELPSQIGQLKNLRTLDLSFTSPLSQLPEQIGQLTELQTLDLSFSSLNQLPEQIGQLKKLKTLNCTQTNLNRLPEQIGQLGDLQTLYLSHTHLDQLPEQISQFTNLQTLYVTHTDLSQLPEQIGHLKNLQDLNLRATSLKELPEQIGQLTELQTLDLSFTPLSQLPEQISQLTELQTLDLSFSSLNQLPEQIGQLKKLKTLSLSNTSLSQLPEQIGQLKNLKSLDLNGTKISEEEISNIKTWLPNCTIQW